VPFSPTILGIVRAKENEASVSTVGMPNEENACLEAQEQT
jgi:hypothetical protein